MESAPDSEPQASSTGSENVAQATAENHALDASCNLPSVSDEMLSGEPNSALPPYRPAATVLTNLQRGNTETTHTTKIKLSFHERAGQGELTQEEIEVVKLSQGGIDCKCSLGFTALHWAVYYDQHRDVEMLIQAGANVNEEAPKLVTPLMLAAAAGYHDVVRLLLEHGAETSHVDIMGNTALMYAAGGNHPDTCNELLLANPCDIRITNKDDQTAYTLAIQHDAHLTQAVLDEYFRTILEL